MKRLSAEELRAARKAEDYRTLWEQADDLCKFAVSSMIRGGMDKQYATDDMLQEARMGAGKAVRTWDPAKGEFSTWITGRARYAISDHIRRLLNGMVGGRDVQGTTGEYHDYAPCEKEQAEDITSRESDILFGRYVLDQLDDFEEVQLLRMRYGFDGEPMSVPEIAKAMGQPLRTTERMLKNIQEKLAGVVKMPR